MFHNNSDVNFEQYAHETEIDKTNKFNALYINPFFLNSPLRPPIHCLI